MQALAIELAKRGYVTATVSYRLSGEALYPAAIYDVKSSVRWLRTHADSYQIDSHKIVIAGASAGGQIAALVGVTNGQGKFDPNAVVYSADYVNELTPPTLFIVSSVPRFSLGYVEMANKLEFFHIQNSVIPIPNSPHSFWFFDPWLQPTANAIENFLHTIWAEHPA